MILNAFAAIACANVVEIVRGKKKNIDIIKDTDVDGTLIIPWTKQTKQLRRCEWCFLLYFVSV